MRRSCSAAPSKRSAGEFSFVYRYILSESCSQFDSLPLTYLTFTSAGFVGKRSTLGSGAFVGTLVNASDRVVWNGVDCADATRSIEAFEVPAFEFACAPSATDLVVVAHNIPCVDAPFPLHSALHFRPVPSYFTNDSPDLRTNRNTRRYIAEYASDAPTAVLSVHTAAASLLPAGVEVTLTCDGGAALAVTPPVLVISAASTEESVVRVAAIADNAQLPSRNATLTCTETSPTRATTTHTIALRIAGVAQPSLSAMCALAQGEVVTATSALPESCGSSVTTNGNASVLFVGGTCPTCPQPPFDDGGGAGSPSAATSLTIGGVDVVANVVPGSAGTRFVAKLPSIAELLGNSSDSALASFVYGYKVCTSCAVGVPSRCPFVRRSVLTPLPFLSPAPLHPSQWRSPQQNFTVTSPIGAHGLRSGRVTLGPLDLTPPPLAPSVDAAAAGVYYTKHCIGFMDATVDTAGWRDAESAHLFAYSHPPRCIACPAGCFCPGGDRCRAMPGYYFEGEALGDGLGAVATLPTKCAAPSLLRCTGWSAAIARTACGSGYSGIGCGECAENFYASLGTCEPCEQTGPVDAFALPLGANLLLVLLAFPMFACVTGVAVVARWGRSAPFFIALCSARLTVLCFVFPPPCPPAPLLSASFSRKHTHIYSRAAYPFTEGSPHAAQLLMNTNDGPHVHLVKKWRPELFGKDWFSAEYVTGLRVSALVMWPLLPSLPTTKMDKRRCVCLSIH